MSLFNHAKKTLLLSALIITTADAASIFPRGCEVTGFAFEQNVLVLNESGNQAYFLIQNRSNVKIELERYESEESFMSPPLQATFSPASWGAFASDVKNVTFRCYQHIDDNTSAINCGDVLEVCQYPRARFALSNMGNYWIASNKSQKDIIQDSVNKGIYLKW
ncbi:MAG: enhanced entry protein EnhB [Legionella sp.]